MRSPTLVRDLPTRSGDDTNLLSLLIQISEANQHPQDGPETVAFQCSRRRDIATGEPVPHDAARLVETRPCGNPVSVNAYHAFAFSDSTCCDECSTLRQKRIETEAMKDYWSRACPKRYRNTDLKHPSFNIQAWRKLHSIPLASNVMIVGTTGQCKTRMACERGKRAILKGYSCRFLWPDKLKLFGKMQWSGRDYVEELTSPKYLLIDDAFLAGSREQSAEFLKDIVDSRLREEKTTVITSQVSGKEWKEDAGKFGNMTKQEADRLDAVIRRIREGFVVVDADAGEEYEQPEKTLF